jgi:hypothetical protein
MNDLSLTKTVDMVTATVQIKLSTGNYTCRALVNRKKFEALSGAERVTVLRDALFAQLRIHASQAIEEQLQRLVRVSDAGVQKPKQTVLR